jgi:uncharacterized phage protein gp47/JayE
MINVARASQNKVTDFSVGGVARTLMESPAIEIEELYLQMLLGLQEAIPTAVFRSFSFDRLEAQGASGVVRFSASGVAAAEIVVPSGTYVTTAQGGNRYYTRADAVIAIGQSYVDVLVYCDTSGFSTNVTAGSLTVLGGSVSGIVSVTNALDFTNGRDLETDDERKTRFQWYVTTLSRGTTNAVKYGATQAVVLNASGIVVESVKHVAVIEPWILDSGQPVGLVNVYIHNGSGSTSTDLVNNATSVINGYYLSDGTPVPGWKAAGVKVVVAAAAESTVAVTGVITMNATGVKATAIASATTLINQYLASLDIGQPAIRSEIIALIMSVTDVYNVSLSAPSGDTTVSTSTKIMPGTITLT